MHTVDWRKFFYVFLITLTIFMTAFYVSNKFSEKKISDIQTMQNRIAIDILSSETQFTLLSESSCETVGDNSLSKDLDSLGAKLAYAQANINSGAEDILWLKKNYSLLEIKDYVLMKKIAASCPTKPIYILYFYTNETGAGACKDCQKEGLVLTELRSKYPGLRVYSFDYDLDLAALKTLESLFGVKRDLPTVVIHGEAYPGFLKMEDIEKLMPELEVLAATSTEQVKD